uniref:Uncharacterized protein n=1 Tax=Rhizophora mucronata TaxID=61149 RepID=A0A2P2QCM1_RHIMU
MLLTSVSVFICMCILNVYSPFVLFCLYFLIF